MINVNSLVQQEEIRRYIALRETVEKLVRELSGSIEAMSVSANNFGECLSINEERADSRRIEECRNSLISQKRSLETIIIPMINQEIARISE